MELPHRVAKTWSAQMELSYGWTPRKVGRARRRGDDPLRQARISVSVSIGPQHQWSRLIAIVVVAEHTTVEAEAERTPSESSAGTSPATPSLTPWQRGGAADCVTFNNGGGNTPSTISCVGRAPPLLPRILHLLRRQRPGVRSPALHAHLPHHRCACG
jgi:hypothetical protein